MKVSKSIFLVGVIVHSPKVLAVSNSSIQQSTNIFDGGVETEVVFVSETSDLVPDDEGLVATMMNPNDADASGIGGDVGVEVTASNNNMLDNQIICGYQGWYSFPGDGAPTNRWRHWFKPPSAYVAAPLAGDLMVDMYPTTDEYNATDMKDSGIRMSDGSYAKFFSSARPNVVLKHFQWMQTHGISGVFQIRFMAGLHIDADREWKTMVLRNSRRAAELTVNRSDICSFVRYFRERHY